MNQLNMYLICADQKYNWKLCRETPHNSFGFIKTESLSLGFLWFQIYLEIEELILLKKFVFK